MFYTKICVNIFDPRTRLFNTKKILLLFHGCQEEGEEEEEEEKDELGAFKLNRYKKRKTNKLKLIETHTHQ